MSEPLTELRNTLAKHGHSTTTARRTVFEALQDKEPQTMNELVAACEQQIDRASVYRTVAVFEQIGIVQRLQIGWKYKLELSDTFHHHHHHLSCSICGKTFSLPEDAELENRLSQLALDQQFVMHGHQIEIQGICKNCTKT